MAYKSIHDNFWRDNDIKLLSSDEKLFLVYAITNPHAHFSGIYCLPRPFIEYELGFSLNLIDKCIDTLSEGYRKGIDTVSKGENTVSKGVDRVSEGNFFLRYDSDKDVLWVRSMLKYQVFMRKVSPKVISGIKNHMLALPLTPLLGEFSRHYAELKLPFFDLRAIPYTTLPFLSVSESVSVSEISGNLAQLTEGDKVRLERLLEKLSGNGFNPYAFLQKALLAEIPLEVCEKVLKKLIKYKENIVNPWGYAVDILKKDYAEFNYAKNLEEHFRLKGMNTAGIFKSLAKGPKEE